MPREELVHLRWRTTDEPLRPEQPGQRFGVEAERRVAGDQLEQRVGPALLLDLPRRLVRRWRWR